MAMVEQRSVKNPDVDTSEASETNYKKLYRDSVERYAVLQAQLDSYSSLFTKMGKIEQLKEYILSSLSEKQAMLTQQSHELSSERREWRQRLSETKEKRRELEKVCTDLQSTCDLYRTEHAQSIRLCGRLLTQIALVTAQSRLQKKNICSLEEKVSEKSVEVQRLKRTVSKYAHSLQRSQQEFKESMDFSEVERLTLVETNAELDLKLSNLTTELTQAKQQMEETRSRLREMEERLAMLQKENRDKENNPVKHTCSGCGQLQQDLDVTLRVLNDQSCAKYGDLLRNNFTLIHKLKVKEEEMAKGIIEYERLSTYTQEYKIKSKQKVEVLKENLRKADKEITELDQLIDQVRAVMHQEIDIVKHSPALLQLIRDLDGVEAPKTY